MRSLSSLAPLAVLAAALACLCIACLPARVAARSLSNTQIKMPHHHYTGDFDGDGKPDFLVLHGSIAYFVDATLEAIGLGGVRHPDAVLRQDQKEKWFARAVTGGFSSSVYSMAFVVDNKGAGHLMTLKPSDVAENKRSATLLSSSAPGMILDDEELLVGNFLGLNVGEQIMAYNPKAGTARFFKLNPNARNQFEPVPKASMENVPKNAVVRAGLFAKETIASPRVHDLDQIVFIVDNRFEMYMARRKGRAPEIIGEGTVPKTVLGLTRKTSVMAAYVTNEVTGLVFYSAGSQVAPKGYHLMRKLRLDDLTEPEEENGKEHVDVWELVEARRVFPGRMAAQMALGRMFDGDEQVDVYFADALYFGNPAFVYLAKDRKFAAFSVMNVQHEEPYMLHYVQLAVIPCEDQDGDGIRTELELGGDGLKGGAFEQLQALGASPFSKDVFVEVDYMATRKPSEKAFPLIVQEFARNGINVHFLVDEEVEHVETLGSAEKPFYSADHEDFNKYYDNHFDFRRKDIFRYCLIGDKYMSPKGSASSGIGQLPGDRFLVTLGSQQAYLGSRWARRQSRMEAGTVAHELGHCLGLAHGGTDKHGVTDNVNLKPNEVSVMNYLFQFTGWVSGTTIHSGYSEIDCDAIDETKVDEATAVTCASTTDGDADSEKAKKFAGTVETVVGGRGGTKVKVNGAVDLDGDDKTDGEVSFDMNKDSKKNDLAGTTNEYKRLDFSGASIGIKRVENVPHVIEQCALGGGNPGVYDPNVHSINMDVDGSGTEDMAGDRVPSERESELRKELDRQIGPGLDGARDEADTDTVFPSARDHSKSGLPVLHGSAEGEDGRIPSKEVEVPFHRVALAEVAESSVNDPVRELRNPVESGVGIMSSPTPRPNPRRAEGRVLNRNGDGLWDDIGKSSPLAAVYPSGLPKQRVDESWEAFEMRVLSERRSRYDEARERKEFEQDYDLEQEAMREVLKYVKDDAKKEKKNGGLEIDLPKNAVLSKFQVLPTLLSASASKKAVYRPGVAKTKQALAQGFIPFDSRKMYDVLKAKYEGLEIEDTDEKIRTAMLLYVPDPGAGDVLKNVEFIKANRDKPYQEWRFAPAPDNRRHKRAEKEELPDMLVPVKDQGSNDGGGAGTNNNNGGGFGRG